MPLLGLVDGVRTVSTMLSAEEWRALQADVRAGKRSVLLPNCGSPAYLRTSKLGVRHFAHRATIDCLAHQKETGQHLYAKSVIVEAARDCGWNAEPEAQGPGWVADVLAIRGSMKVAFEVQWSKQTRLDFERRQIRYAADNIRCAWFTRHERDVPFPAPDLPVFQMQFVDGAITTRINQSVLPLRDTVVALLTRRVGFRSHVAPGHGATVHVACFEYGCYRCNAVSLFWEVEREELQGPCGTAAEIRHGTLWANERAEAGASVKRRVAAESRRLGTPLAKLGRRFSRTAQGSYTAFSCPWCDALFGDWFLRDYMIEALSEDAFT